MPTVVPVVIHSVDIPKHSPRKCADAHSCRYTRVKFKSRPLAMPMSRREKYSAPKDVVSTMMITETIMIRLPNMIEYRRQRYAPRGPLHKEPMKEPRIIKDEMICCEPAFGRVSEGCRTPFCRECTYMDAPFTIRSLIAKDHEKARHGLKAGDGPFVEAISKQRDA